MALSALTQWEVRTLGSATNGGGFVAGASGTDWSQQNSAQYALTTLTTSGANAVILTALASADMVGNIIQITGGTNFTTGFFQILSVSVGVSITCDRNVATGVGAAGTANIGGALTSVTTTFASSVAGNVTWVKADGTYSPTGGVMLITAQTLLIGYATTRGDNGLVTFDATGMTALATTFQVNTLATAANIKVLNSKNASFSGSGGVNGCFNCYANGGASGFATVTICVACTAVSAGNNGFTGCSAMISCYASGNAVMGFSLPGTGCCVGCISANNTGGGFTTTNACSLTNCVAFGNTTSGFTTTNKGSYVNCISYGNSAYGWNFAANTDRTGTSPVFINCAAGSNTSGATNLFPNVFATAPLALSANPFTSSGTLDFSLNTTAGGGAACRAAGFPGIFITPVTSTGYLDIGAIQHQDAGGATAAIGIQIAEPLTYFP